MAQNYMMGAGMVPPAAPTPPSQLSFKSDPNQRMQFKSFMQGLSAPQAPMAPPMAPPMMPMPQIPVPMQNIDVFSQPVQNMANGGRASRPQDRAARRAAGEAAAKRIFSKDPPRPPVRKPEKRERDRGGVLNRPTTNKQIAEANAIAAALSSSRPSDRYGSGSDARTVAELAGKSSTDQIPVSRTSLYDSNYITPLESEALNQAGSLDMLNFIGSRLSDSAPFLPVSVEPTPTDIINRSVEDRRAQDLGIASIQTPADQINQSIQEALGRESGLTNVDSMPMVTPVYDPISELDAEDAALIDPLGVSPLSRPMEPNFLSRLPFGLGEYFLKGQVQDLQEFVDIPGAEYDYSARSGTAPAGQGTLNISPSGVVTYTGRRDPNYTGPFSNLINPPTRPEREVNPCPPGYTLVNGACMPISQPIAQATPATPAPNVISNIPVTTAASSPVVQSTAPPAQLGMPLGQPSPIQPMSQFLTNIPNSLNLAANNFLSALSS